MNMMWVQGDPRLDDGKTAFWERHPEHPNGEVFIKAGQPRPTQVADTPDVRQAIQEGRLSMAQDPGDDDDEETVEPSQAARRTASSGRGE